VGRPTSGVTRAEGYYRVPPEIRRARARLGGLTTAALGHHDTETGRLAAEARFERQVRDEAAAAGETLTDYQVARRAAAARRLFYARLTFASAKVRRARADARRGYSLNGKPAPVSETTESGHGGGHRATGPSSD
jgi:hypothetical protein